MKKLRPLSLYRLLLAGVYSFFIFACDSSFAEEEITTDDNYVAENTKKNSKSKKHSIRSKKKSKETPPPNPKTEKLMNNLGDLTFFPAFGHLLSDTNVSAGLSDSTLSYGNHSLDTLSKKNYTVSAESLRFSFLPRNLIGVDIVYGTEDNTSTSTGKSRKNKASGFDNPKFVYAARLAEQIKNDYYNVDLQLGYSPNLIVAKDSTQDKAGTISSGRDSYSLSATLSGKNPVTPPTVWALTPEIIYLGKKTKKSQQIDAETVTDPSMLCKVHLGIQQYLAKNVRLNSGWYYSYTTSSKSYSAISQQTTTIGGYNSLGVEVGLDATLVADRWNVYFLITTNGPSSANFTITSADGDSVDGNYYINSGNSFTLGTKLLL